MVDVIDLAEVLDSGRAAGFGLCPCVVCAEVAEVDRDAGQDVLQVEFRLAPVLSLTLSGILERPNAAVF